MAEADDDRRDVYRTRHDPESGDPVWYAVIEAVAAVRGVDPLEVEELGAVFDLDAFDSLFVAPESGGPSDADARLSFVLDGCPVIVTAGGVIEVAEPDGSDDAAAWLELSIDRLLRDAAAAGVDVEGGWESHGPDGTGWRVTVRRVRR